MKRTWIKHVKHEVHPDPNEDGMHFCLTCDKLVTMTKKGECPGFAKEKREREHRAQNKHRYPSAVGVVYLTSDQRQEIMNQFAQVCPICFATEDLVLDHCHETGKFRGVLCKACNRMIGVAKDDVELLKRAIQYLMK